MGCAGRGKSENSRDASAHGALQRSLSPFQIIVILGLILSVTAMAIRSPRLPWDVAVFTLHLAFLFCAGWRVLLVVAARPTPGRPLAAAPDIWPRYTILAALHDEAEVAHQLISRLAEIDYPHDRLEALLLLEAHDLETLDAVLAVDRPHWMHIVVVPPGSPGTKPRALNHGLARATGDLIVIYDAEDDPDPLQLREAAGRFADDGAGRLACLQAPLRIRTRFGRPNALQRQFAVEYAALFEITLPAMARLGLPFPLGGTSNHFRTDVLRALGGWDAYNVTEDADLGFRLWRSGWRLDVIRRPTYESAPEGVQIWLPQRTRWLKGYMQTWGVHTRTLQGLGWRGVTALVMSLGLALVSAGMHAVAMAWMTMSLVMAVAAGAPPTTGALSLSVLVLGLAAAWLQCVLGARKAHTPYSAADMILAPLYWSMLSLAFAHAAWRLIREPHAWDKTPHQRDPVEDQDMEAFLAEPDLLAAGRQAA